MDPPKFRDSHYKFMPEITSNFLAAVVDPPKFRDTRHTLLVHAKYYIQKKRQGAFPKSKVACKNKREYS
jgi:hypothetical protein